MSERHPHHKTLTPQEALRLVKRLSRDAKEVTPEAAKKILLIAGCQIADLGLAELNKSRAA